MTDGNYLVRLNADFFFLEFGENEADVRGTKILSQAEHMAYSGADSLTQSLRSRNYDAVVCDRYGREVTQKVLAENETAASTLPEEPADFYSMPIAVMKRRYFSESRFKNRVDEAVQKGLIPQPIFLKDELSDVGTQTAPRVSGAALAQMIPAVATGKN